MPGRPYGDLWNGRPSGKDYLFRSGSPSLQVHKTMERKGSVARVVLAFGSNTGDRKGHIAEALELVKSFVTILAVSGVYETEPLYVLDQSPFYNGVLVCETELDPSTLLERLKEIETMIGRTAQIRNGPREIDLDIIDFDGQVLEGAIVLPHPRAFERRFVLEPLNEIDPEFLLTGYGRAKELLSDPSVQSQVVRRVADAAILL